MAIHPDTVAQTVSEVLVPWPVACVFDHLSGCRINSLARRSRFCRTQRGRLRLQNNIPDLAHLVRWLSKDNSPGHVRLVPFHRTAVVHHHDGAFSDRLGPGGTVGKSAPLTHLNTHKTRISLTRHASLNQRSEIAVAHVLFHGLPRSPVGLQSDGIRQLHQRQFGRRFTAPATSRHRGSTGDLKTRVRAGETVSKRKDDLLFDPDGCRRKPQTPQPLSKKRIRVLIFLPRPDLDVLSSLFAGTFLFESRTDEEGLALAGNNVRKETLGISPAEIGEVAQRGPAGQANRVDLVVRHQLPRPFYPSFKLGWQNRFGFRAATLEGCDRGRELDRGHFGCRALRQQRSGQGGLGEQTSADWVGHELVSSGQKISARGRTKPATGPSPVTSVGLFRTCGSTPGR